MNFPNEFFFTIFSESTALTILGKFIVFMLSRVKFPVLWFPSLNLMQIFRQLFSFPTYAIYHFFIVHHFVFWSKNKTVRPTEKVMACISYIKISLISRWNFYLNKNRLKFRRKMPTQIKMDFTKNNLLQAIINKTSICTSIQFFHSFFQFSSNILPVLLLICFGGKTKYEMSIIYFYLNWVDLFNYLLFANLLIFSNLYNKQFCIFLIFQ